MFPTPAVLKRHVAQCHGGDTVIKTSHEADLLTQANQQNGATDDVTGDDVSHEIEVVGKLTPESGDGGGSSREAAIPPAFSEGITHPESAPGTGSEDEPAEVVAESPEAARYVPGANDPVKLTLGGEEVEVTDDEPEFEPYDDDDFEPEEHSHAGG